MQAKANSFENLLDPFLKIFRISTSVTIGIAKSQFFKRITEKMSHSKAHVRLNLLKLLNWVCEVHPNRTMLIERFGLYDVVLGLSRDDPAVLVRQLAGDLLPLLAHMAAGRIKEDTLKVFGHDYPTQYVFSLLPSSLLSFRLSKETRPGQP